MPKKKSSSRRVELVPVRADSPEVPQILKRFAEYCAARGLPTLQWDATATPGGNLILLGHCKMNGLDEA